MNEIRNTPLTKKERNRLYLRYLLFGCPGVDAIHIIMIAFSSSIPSTIPKIREPAIGSVLYQVKAAKYFL